MAASSTASRRPPTRGDTENEDRLAIEQALLDNEVKVVVATSALGMGFDKPDLAFVIHYQAPGSPIAYYQQVGRAGRRLDESLRASCCGAPRTPTSRTTSSAPPSRRPTRPNMVVQLLEERSVPVSKIELLELVNLRPGQLDLLLKTLEVDGAIERDGSAWLRTLRPWTYDADRVEAVTALRRAEQDQMSDYARRTDVPGAAAPRLPRRRRHRTVRHVRPLHRHQPRHRPRPRARRSGPSSSSGQPIIAIEPRKRLPVKGAIKADRRPETGRALAVWGDGGWGSLVRTGRTETGRFDDQLVDASATLIAERWKPDPAPTWVTYVPSLRQPRAGGRPRPAPRRRARAARARTRCGRCGRPSRRRSWRTASQQHANVVDAFAVTAPVPAGPVLLVDDTVDSRWTLTEVAALLLEAGSGPVHPFVLADTMGRSLE